MAETRKTTARAPRTAKPKPEPEAGIEGQVDPAAEYGQIISRTDAGRTYVTSNRFNAANVEVRGRELLAHAPINHVGPANLIVPMAELPELISDLIALRDNPAQLVDEG